jgi:hypothetical protein
MSDNYKFSQDLEIIPPQKQLSYPISTSEWNIIKKKIGEVKDNSNLWHTLGSILIGAAISTLIAALINDFKTEKLLWTCWAAFCVTVLVGALSFYFGREQRKIQNKSKEDVIDYMTIIEERFQNSIQTSAQLAEQGIIIQSAKYGAEGKSIDLASKISELVSKNKLIFKANNELGGDPIHGKRKTLEIVYTIDGKKKVISALEGTTVKIE